MSEYPQSETAMLLRIAQLEDALGEALGVAYWMSGSQDFSPEGIAHVGWLKARPRLRRAEAALSGEAPEKKNVGE